MAQSRPRRRLVAILSADMVGYSRLMEEGEDDTHSRLAVLRQKLLGPAVVSHRGRIVKTMGDGFLAVFDSVLDAARCAIALQRQVGAREAGRAGKRISFRMGIDVGDVILDQDDIFGNAVNKATRLQQFANPGGIVISAAVRDHLGSRLDVPAVDLGELRLKFMRQPVRAFALQLSANDHPEPRDDVSSRASIAVLPFRDPQAAPEQAYFGDGIVEDIIGSLANLKELFVISHGSTLAYRAANVDVRAVGQSLGVRYVLSGSVRRTAQRLRITGELCDTETGTVMWAERYDGDMSDLFALQDRIAGHIVAIIAPQVRQAELKRALAKRPENMDAYDLLLQAADLLYRLNPEDFARARVLLERAMTLEPSYAMPYAIAAKWHGLRFGQGWSADEDADIAEEDRLARAAIERDPANPLALALCGHHRSYLFRDYDAALALFDRALTASPNSAIAWTLSSPTYSYMGDGPTAVVRAERALRLSPLDRHAFWYHTTLTLAHYVNGTYEEAVVWGRRVMHENPAFTANLRILTASLVALGGNEEAGQVARRLLAVQPSFRVAPFIARYAIRDEARRARFADELRRAGLPD